MEAHPLYPKASKNLGGGQYRGSFNHGNSSNVKNSFSSERYNEIVRADVNGFTKIPSNGASMRLKTPDGSFRASGVSQESGIDLQQQLSNTNVAGILHKWVNYGKGWKSRWFVLEDGVLSYYKIHGPDKIAVNYETEKGRKVIGEESLKLMRNPKSSFAHVIQKNERKTFGAVHLKVSSVRESRSDDKRFSLFTGTKTLHLRTDSREDRATWIESLVAAKDLFPSRSISNNFLMPVEEIVVSTEKLRCRLQAEGLNDELIRDCEDIMLSEFSELQSQLKFLEQKRFNLLDTLRQLEAEKVDLETTVVDASQCCSKQHDIGEYEHGKYSGSATESEADNERQDGAEVETDEDDEIFFDTKDSLSDSIRSSSSGFRRISTASDEGFLDSEDFLNGTNEIDADMELSFDYPLVERRKSLPEPKEKEKGVSLWSMIKDNIGKDLTRVCLPVYFNEPLSSLQKCFEDMEYSYLIDLASDWGRKGNNLMRILYVAAFAVSGYSSSEGRYCKPFNPLLGETFEADYPDKGLRFFAEKVSHHPMLIACHCEGRGWKFWGDSNLKSKFWGRSIQVDPVGILTLEFDDGEVFQWSKVTTSIYNLILGKLYCDHYGTMRIQGNCEYSCKLKFKEQSIIDRNPHQVQGFVQDRDGNKVATLLGKWDESMYYILGDITTKPKGFDPMSEACLLWKKNKPAKNPTRYNLTSLQ